MKCYTSISSLTSNTSVNALTFKIETITYQIDLPIVWLTDTFFASLVVVQCVSIAPQHFYAVSHDKILM